MEGLVARDPEARWKASISLRATAGLALVHKDVPDEGWIEDHAREEQMWREASAHPAVRPLTALLETRKWTQGWYGAANPLVLIVSGTRGNEGDPRSSCVPSWDQDGQPWARLFFGMDNPYLADHATIQKAAICYTTCFALGAWGKRAAGFGTPLSMILNVSPECVKSSKTRDETLLAEGYEFFSKAVDILKPETILFADPEVFLELGIAKRFCKDFEGRVPPFGAAFPQRGGSRRYKLRVGIWKSSEGTHYPAVVPPIKANRQSLPMVHFGMSWTQFWYRLGQAVGATAPRIAPPE